MSLINDLNQVFEVTGLNSDVSNLSAGRTNLAAFKRAIDTALWIPGSSPPRYRGTLYVPPGTYVIAPDTEVAANWALNLRAVSRQAQAAQDRRGNPFGASIVFPPGTTLWLAPKAVLAPTSGCVLDVSSLLVCENTQCFDPTLGGGLVVFGTAVPTVRPEWWGAVDGQDASAAIQAAIDAAIHDRLVTWPEDGAVYSLKRPPLAVELRGEYSVGTTIEVRADATTNGIVRQHSTGVPPTAPSGASVETFDAATVIRGAWSGARRQGASLIADKRLGQAPLLSLIRCWGISVRNIAFSTWASGYQPSVDIKAKTPGTSTGNVVVQDIALRSCRFEGASTPLVQVGAHPVVHPPDALSDLPYVDADFEISSDICLLSFEDCDFQVRSGGVGVDMRAGNALSMRFRRCDFSGDAATFMSLWNGTRILEGCRFQNSRMPSDPKTLDPDSLRRGMEPPDGSDLFLRRELSVRNAAGVVAPAVADLLPGLTALGCVSSSHRFLSTVRPVTNGQQAQEWPVVLLNVRQQAPGAPVSPAVRWGMQHIHSVVEMGDRGPRPMSRGAPLAVVGGAFSSGVEVLRGAVQSVVVAVRVSHGGVVSPPPNVSFFDERAPGGHAPVVRCVVFGLPADERF